MPTKKAELDVAEQVQAEYIPIDCAGLMVAKKIHMLREKVKEITPSKMEAGRQKYNYLSEREMTNTLRPVMQELGLVDVCIGTEMHTEAFVLPKKDGNTDENKSVLLTEVIKTYRVYDIITGDWVDFKAVGSGSDTMDKGCNKAVTGARKNFLKDLGNFPSPEREDPDTTPSSGYSANKSSGSAGDVVLKYGVHAGKSLQDLFDENPEEVEKIAAAKDKSGNPTWIAQKAQAFLNTLAAA